MNGCLSLPHTTQHRDGAWSEFYGTNNANLEKILIHKYNNHHLPYGAVWILSFGGIKIYLIN